MARRKKRKLTKTTRRKSTARKTVTVKIKVGK